MILTENSEGPSGSSQAGTALQNCQALCPCVHQSSDAGCPRKRAWPCEKQLSPLVGNFHRGLEAAGNSSFSLAEGTHQSILYTKGESVEWVNTEIHQEPDYAKAMGQVLVYQVQSLEDLRELRC